MTAPLLVPMARPGRGKAVAAFSAALVAAGCAQLMAGCAPRPADRATGPSGGAPSAESTSDLFRKAMPAASDFPGSWHVEAQTARPAALPGLDDGSTAITTVVPDECGEFAAGFVAAPGSSIPGDFVSSVIAMIPNREGVFDQSSVVFFATRDAGGWGSPRAIRDSARSCGKVVAQMSVRGRTTSAEFSSAPVDTSGINGEAAGLTTVLHVGGANLRMAVVRATTRGVLVCASSMIVSEPGDDQQALLVELVARTVDRLNAL